MGISPDYMNTVIMSFASSASILKGRTNCFPENIQSLYETAREKDLSFTHTFATHQVITRQIVKTEFILGIVELLIHTINISEYQHVQEKVAEIIIGLETMKALLEKSEADATLDEWDICVLVKPHYKLLVTYFLEFIHASVKLSKSSELVV